MKATIYHVARRARVSTATVSRFLNGTGPVAAETRHRIEQAIQVLAYSDVGAHRYGGDDPDVIRRLLEAGAARWQIDALAPKGEA